IRQTFLYDAKQRGFCVSSEASDLLHDHQFDLDAASLDESAHEPLQSRDEARFVEQGRMEQIGQCRKLLDHTIAERHALLQCVLNALAHALRRSLYSVQVRSNCRHILNRYVVKIPRDSPLCVV